MEGQRETSANEQYRNSILCREPMIQNDVHFTESLNENNMDKRSLFSLFCGRTRIVQDGCWACVSLIAAALVQFIVMGIHNSFGNMYQQILKEFEWKESTSGIADVFL